MSDFTEDSLHMTFDGRIIDHLGIQMYQSPTAAIAELIANAWDAVANSVQVVLPERIDSNAVITIADDGIGMTFNECQQRFLNVGYCRRPTATEPSADVRPVLGRKGIGKFAGFGIADILHVDTTSKATGERTTFELDVNSLRRDEYIGPGRNIDAKRYPSGRKHGTVITLKSLKLKRRTPLKQFRRSMSRRFLLLERANEFRVSVNGEPIPQDADTEAIEYVFPRDYPHGKRPGGVRVEGDGTWGIETLPNSQTIRWSIRFYRDPIDEDELCGISVFAGVKLAQRPFFFNLSGGLGGQHGQQYMSGIVKADYIDQLSEDIIATERQRINWEHAEAIPLEEWGKNRVKELLRLWRDMRGEAKRRMLEDKVAVFSDRLEKLPRHEQRTVKRALVKIGSIEALTNQQFESLALAILLAWEQGRLRELIDAIADRDDLSPDKFLELLTEADVLVALNIAEVIKSKIEAIHGLRRLVERNELENAVRDYISERPYLLDPKWETYTRERRVEGILATAAEDAKLTGDVYKGRVDLALSSGNCLLVVEFMRPGLALDYDHLSRIKRYMNIIRAKLRAESSLGFKVLEGLVVADKLEKKADIQEELEDLKSRAICASSWDTLLRSAENTWREFMEIVAGRAPSDDRVKALAEVCNDG
ncbi:MAG TPA: ATP-binding protein [Phycisphaerae bacterium]|nr:ATP-binding protein [Phycisphaerae bacterium]